MSTVICSHGFGVRADARGMFTELAAAFPEHTFVTFDYNKLTTDGDLIVSPLDEQGAILERQLDDAEDVVLLAHSQGCIVAGLADLRNVSRVILLAPPVLTSIERVTDKLSRTPGAEIDLEGVSKLPRRDGTTTHISRQYLDSLDGIDPLTLYRRIASDHETIIVRATEDEVLGLTNVDEVTGARLIDLKSDHDFQGDARGRLIEVLRPLL